MLVERPFVSRQLAIEALDDAVLKGVLDYWRSRKGDRAVPLRAEILPEDMAPYLHRLALLEVLVEPPYFRFRLVGGTAQLVFGVQVTGRSLEAVQHPAHAAALRDLCQAIVLQEQPQCREISIRQGQRHFAYRLIGLPLSSDGSRIDRLLLAPNWSEDQVPITVAGGVGAGAL